MLSMILKVKGMNLTSFYGENVSSAVGQLKMAITRLKVVNKIPIEINRYILDVLQTSTVPAFNLFFAQLEINLKQIPSFILTWEQILTMADTRYQEMKLLGQWSSIHVK